MATGVRRRSRREVRRRAHCRPSAAQQRYVREDRRWLVGPLSAAHPRRPESPRLHGCLRYAGSGLLPVTDSTPYDVEWIMATDIPYTNAMYPLGLTPRRGVERVLPNHYLDLKQWALVRRWPKGDLPFDRDPSEAVRTVAATASRTIDGIAAAYSVQSPITAGRDSRLMLACS